ncbi:peptidoglycan-binding protein LysM [bacterium]|nr:peptidoglycan-binding protein LysM [bacterium]MBU1752705.1 peptidoglycan-binding protein LysM [bacterium]
MIEKAKIKRLDTNEEITVMFNPIEYSVTATGQLTGEGTCLQFQRVNLEDFSIPLFFDTYEKQTDVRKEIKNLTALVMPTVEGKKTKQPPVCLFVWGKFLYKGIIYKIDQRFTMFLETGIPVRAEITVTFKSIVTTEEDAALKGNEACRKIWTVKSGDRLDLIAYKTLKDASLWRKITEVNNIINPRTFPTNNDIGKLIVVPDYERDYNDKR